MTPKCHIERLIFSHHCPWSFCKIYFLYFEMPSLVTCFHYVSLGLMSISAHLSFFLPLHIIFKSLLTLISLYLSLCTLLLTIIQCHSYKYYFHIDQSQFSSHESSIESLLSDIWLVFLNSRPSFFFLFLPLPLPLPLLLLFLLFLPPSHYPISLYLCVICSFSREDFFVYPWVSWNFLWPGWPQLQRSVCLCHPMAGIKVRHHRSAFQSCFWYLHSSSVILPMWILFKGLYYLQTSEWQIKESLTAIRLKLSSCQWHIFASNMSFLHFS